MATIDILRRRIAMAQAKVDEYEGVELGYLQSSPYLVTDVVLAVTPIIEIPADCKTITGFAGGLYTGGCWAVLLDENMTRVLHGNATGSGTIGFYNNVPSTAKYIQMSFNVDRIDDVYIFDNTHNVYLFKGKNVT